MACKSCESVGIVSCDCSENNRYEVAQQVWKEWLTTVDHFHRDFLEWCKERQEKYAKNDS